MKTYRVVRAPGPDDVMPPSYYGILGGLKAGETVTTAGLYDRLDGRVSKSTSHESARGLVRAAVRHAASSGMLLDISEAPPRPYKEFQAMPSVARWLAMLNTSNVVHGDDGTGGTRRIYGYALYRFSNWLEGKKWTLTVREDAGGGSYREVRVDVVIRDMDHLLELAIERGGIDRDLSLLVRQFFADKNAEKSIGTGTLTVVQNAIRSFFTCHELQYGLRLPRSMLRGSERDDGWEDRTLRLSEFYRMLSVGRPTIRDKAVLLSKFHRGLDLMTLADRFNYTAFDQMAAHMGTDDAAVWDLDKCPVPIVLVRVKTNYRHVGFLERDAMQANIDWIAERQRLTGAALRRGDNQPLYIMQNGRPVTTGWVGARFRCIARRVGLCAERGAGGVQASTRHSHQLRHLLKSTLIDAGCRIDVADHVIGHAPKDAYEKQAVLYPESLRREYAKAAAKINIFSNFEASIDSGDDIHKLRAEVEADRKRLQMALAAAEAGMMRRDAAAAAAGGGGGEAISGPAAEAIAALQEDVRRLRECAGLGTGGAGAAREYQCISCSLVHSLPACPACGSAERRIYAGAAAAAAAAATAAPAPAPAPAAPAGGGSGGRT